MARMPKKMMIPPKKAEKSAVIKNLTSKTSPFETQP
jgi:hypothetical protein